jgi:predicted DCC family thiol-disulfide oxidoreductase YuxK
LIALNLILLDFSSLRDGVARRLARRGPLRILYDGSCKYCRGTVRVLTAMDLFSRLTVTDFRRLDLAEFNRANGCALDGEALEQEMALVWRGRVYFGFRAYRVLSTAVPALWIVAPLMYIPGMALLGTWMYRYVAFRRHGHGRCDERCEVEAAAAPVFAVAELTTAQRFGYVLGLSGLVVVMTVAFFFKIEFYPFTAMQLFTGLRTSEVTYYRVLGERESGERSRVRLEDAVPLTSFNGRYSIHLWSCFEDDPAEEEICRKFLTASLAAYNRKSPPHERLIAYEVHEVIWDHRVSPDDPMYGRVAERVTVTAGGAWSRLPHGPDQASEQ